jgi:hypothetical protein
MLSDRSPRNGAKGSAADPAVAALAADAIAAIIDAGARTLIAQPWQVARIVRRAGEMTIEELTAHIARRRRATPPADLNLAIAIAQLSCALNSPKFRAAWAEFATPPPPERDALSDCPQRLYDAVY